MKSEKLVVSAVVMLALGFLAACGGGSSMTNPAVPPTGSSPVSITVRDTPPAGVTVLSFEVTVTGAVLHSSTGKPDVVLVSSANPIQIEIKHLETEAAFLSTVNVPADTYKDVAITLANIELTFKNDTNPPQVIANCNPGQVCELKPNIAPMITISSNPPFPLTVSANTPAGLLVDVNLNILIDGMMGINFTAPGGITLTPLTPAPVTGELQEIEDLLGTISGAPANNQFTLQTTQGNFTVKVDNTTLFQDFDRIGCTVNNFTCLQNGQVVEVDLRLLAGGAFLAKKIEFEDPAVDDELEGVVFQIDSLTQFEMVVVEELRDVAGVAVGNPIIVTPQPGGSFQFQVDTNGLTVPPALQSAFQGATDTSQLLPGQAVQIRVRLLTPATPTTRITVQTDRVRLRMSRFTGTVSGTPMGSNFNVSSLPSLFTAAGITQIQVQTLPGQTQFEGVAGVSGLMNGDTVSLRGLLFLQLAPNPPALIADKVRKR